MKTMFRSTLGVLLVALILISSYVHSAAAAGRRIVFASDRTGDSEIFVMDEDGTEVEQITNLGVTSHLASWIPNSSRVLFRSNHGGGDYDLFAIAADGTGLTNLTDSPEDESGGISSPDGSQIAYLQDAGGGDFSLRSINLTTLVSTEIQSGFAGFWWLSNTQLVMYTQDAGVFQLYTVNADGTGKAALTNDLGNSYFASATVDGQQIAYYYNDGTNPPELRTINANGTGKATLTSNVSDDESLVGLPLWSPDGAHILFVYADSADETPLMRIDADGTNLTTLVSPSAGGVWGPDSDSVWYGQQIGGFTEIFVANPDGSNSINLTDSSANNEMFVSAFLFEPLATEPPVTPPTTNEPIATPQVGSTQTLAESGASLAITAIGLLIISSALLLGAYRARYSAR